MPKFALQIQAQMENVTSLKADGEDFRWYMKLRCDNCGDETPEYVYCTKTETSALQGGRGHASLVLKCKLCKRENSVDIQSDSLTSYTIDDAGKFKTIITFDCRGVAPTEFSPRIGWTAEGVDTNTPFSLDLSENEWYDYDEKAGDSVSISEVLFQFTHCKK